VGQTVVLVAFLAVSGSHGSRAAWAGSAGAHGFPNGQAAVQAFFQAYDRHDLRGVLATIDLDSLLLYPDCDYAFLKSYDLANYNLPNNKPSGYLLEQWLRVRFEEHDRFAVIRFVSGVDGAPGVGVVVARSNDLLDELGLSPRFYQYKFATDAEKGYFIQGFSGSAYDCEDLPSGRGLHFSPGPSMTHTRVVVRAFIDAYNGHNLNRALQTMDSQLSYVDCKYTRHQIVDLSSKVALKSWLRARFRDHDRFGHVQFTPNAGTDPRTGDFQAVRRSDSLTLSGLGAQQNVFRVYMNQEGDRISRVRAEQSGQCSHEATNANAGGEGVVSQFAGGGSRALQNSIRTLIASRSFIAR
jgi:hypothetical protein